MNHYTIVSNYVSWISYLTFSVSERRALNVELLSCPVCIDAMNSKLLLKRLKNLAFSLIVSCSKKDNSLGYYLNYPVKFVKKKVVHPENEFEIMIPQNWKWKVEEYEDGPVLSGINAMSEVRETGFFDMISVQKVKNHYENRDLQAELDHALEVMKFNRFELKIIGSGNSNKILDRESVYLHNKSNTGTYGEAEMIAFLVESKEEGTHYELVASVCQTKDLKKNMAMVINCITTFKSKNQK